MDDYAAKPSLYFDTVRREIEPLLPAISSRVLDLGCGAGATLAWLKQAGRCDATVGVEMMESAAAIARGRVDEMFVGDATLLVESAFDAGSFDLVLCLDVLEHLVDPWAFVAKLPRLLKPGGLLIASLPNVRHLRVVLPLLLAGRWRYEASGILDRTHLRFFTRRSALELMSGEGLEVERCLRRLPPWHSKAGLLNLATLGLARDLVTMNYIVASRRVAAVGEA